jgi:DNA-binding transcriptional ArsR family regulator
MVGRLRWETSNPMLNSTSPPVETADLATTFAALGDPRRLALVERLYSGDALSVSVLCKGMDVSRQAVSKHLKTLTDARLVSSERSGRETLYSLERRKLAEANAYLALVGDKWDDAFGRLKLHLADPATPNPVETGSTRGPSRATAAVVKSTKQTKKE